MAKKSNKQKRDIKPYKGPFPINKNEALQNVKKKMETSESSLTLDANENILKTTITKLECANDKMNLNYNNNIDLNCFKDRTDQIDIIS